MYKDNNILKIFTEEPEKELWQALLQYSYKANIKRYYEDNMVNYVGLNDESQLDDLSNRVAGALLQADEYYKASRLVSLQVQPLLLYYGTTNLLYALHVLTTGEIPIINNHGMHIRIDENHKYIADTQIIFDHSNDGGIHVFSKSLGFSTDLCKYREWVLDEFLDSIAEIKDDFERCYLDKQSKALVLDIVNTPDGIVEKIHVDSAAIQNTVSHIEGFNTAYLRPQLAQNLHNDTYFVLRHKMNGSNIQQISYSGQPYLQIAHDKNSQLITIPKELNMYVSLFALGSICRYHPEIWNPFVTQDSTGEKLLIEKMLYYSRRMLPNIVLNRIQKAQVVFVSDKYVPENRVHLVGEHEVREIVSEEVRKQIRQEQAGNIINGRLG